MHRLLLALIILPTFSCAYRYVEVAKEGMSNYEIVVPADADSIVIRAASELQHYLHQITGANIPVTDVNRRDPEKLAIFLGSEFNDEVIAAHTIGYQAKEKDLYIYGGNPKSTLYAVYRFLEREQGCLWLSPDAMKVPETDRIVLDAATKFRYTPQIETRTVHSRLFYNHHTFADKLGVTYEAFPGYVPGAGVHTFHRFMPEGTLPHSFV